MTNEAKLPNYLRVCLRVIQMECEKHESCEDGCPLYDWHFGCKVRLDDAIPCYWNVQENAE